jgi:putative transposase
MPRLPRNETEPAIWHVWARGVERRLIFLDNQDRRLYLGLLGGVAKRLRWRVLAYCLMPNHVHLLIETEKPNLGRGMHLVHGQYAQSFNARYGRVGHLFQSRYGSRVVQDEWDLANVFAYVAVNPVAAALCLRPEDFEWSSYRTSVTSVRHPLIDLGRLRTHLRNAGQSCVEAVEARLVSLGLLVPG